MISHVLRFTCAFIALLITSVTGSLQANGEEVRLGVFNVDVSPPIGSPVAYVPAKSIVDPLSARGVVVLSEGRPVVLCAVDFIGIGNEGQDVWKKALAKAAGTTPDHVSVHALHPPLRFFGGAPSRRTRSRGDSL